MANVTLHHSDCRFSQCNGDVVWSNVDTVRKCVRIENTVRANSEMRKQQQEHNSNKNSKNNNDHSRGSHISMQSVRRMWTIINMHEHVRSIEVKAIKAGAAKKKNADFLTRRFPFYADATNPKRNLVVPSFLPFTEGISREREKIFNLFQRHFSFFFFFHRRENGRVAWKLSINFVAAAGYNKWERERERLCTCDDHKPRTINK